MAFDPNRVSGAIFGASEFDSDKIRGNQSFFRSASEIHRYLTEVDELNIPHANVLNLFNSEIAAGEQVTRISNHLLAAVDSELFIIYYCGHGDYNSEKRYCLTVRSTEPGALFDNTTVPWGNFKETLFELSARGLIVVIIDACFSEGAMQTALSFQSPGDGDIAPELIPAKRISEWSPDIQSVEVDGVKKIRGCVYLFAASAKEEALAPPGRELTMFTEGIISAKNGARNCDQEFISIQWLYQQARHFIKDTFGSGSVIPKIYELDQDGVLNLPLLPTLAIRPIPGNSTISIEFQAISDRLQSIEVVIKKLSEVTDGIPKKEEVIKFFDSLKHDVIPAYRARRNSADKALHYFNSIALGAFLYALNYMIVWDSIRQTPAGPVVAGSGEYGLLWVNGIVFLFSILSIFTLWSGSPSIQTGFRRIIWRLPINYLTLAAVSGALFCLHALVSIDQLLEYHRWLFSFGKPLT